MITDDRRVSVFESDDQKRLRHRRLDDESRRSGAHKSREYRREGQRDIDRSIYAACWRRLGAVTQIVTPPDGRPTFHTRLTHSQKVAQVSRSIAQNIIDVVDEDSPAKKQSVLRQLASFGGYDVDVCEAAGYLHDIGHPPFGHVGEEVLAEYAQKVSLPGGFEGNAQSMRIALVGKPLSHYHEGLDLTAATLAALAKYPWPKNPGTPSESIKYSFYPSELKHLEWCRAFLPAAFGPKVQTLEASTMDTADDITYAVHDLEDFMLAGRVSPREVAEELESYTTRAPFNRTSEVPRNTFAKLAGELPAKYPSYFDPNHFFEACENVLRVLDELDTPAAAVGAENLRETARQRHVFAEMIDEFTQATHFRAGGVWAGGPHIGLDRKDWHKVQILKAITKRFIIASPDMALLQRGQKRILRTLCDELAIWVQSEPERLPIGLADEIVIATAQETGELECGRGGMHAERGDSQRSVLDYLCTLSDNQCVALYKKLVGGHVHSAGISEVF